MRAHRTARESDPPLETNRCLKPSPTRWRKPHLMHMITRAVHGSGDAVWPGGPPCRSRAGPPSPCVYWALDKRDGELHNFSPAQRSTRRSLRSRQEIYLNEQLSKNTRRARLHLSLLTDHMPRNDVLCARWFSLAIRTHISVREALCSRACAASRCEVCGAARCARRPAAARSRLSETNPHAPPIPSLSNTNGRSTHENNIHTRFSPESVLS